MGSHQVGLGDRRLIFTGIAGHAPISVGRDYGLPTLSDMAAALKKFPRYEIDDQNRRTLRIRRASQ
jgi:hypothetical protein